MCLIRSGAAGFPKKLHSQKKIDSIPPVDFEQSAPRSIEAIQLSVAVTCQISTLVKV